MAPCVPLKFRQVSYTTLVFSKNLQIPTVSKFDENRRGSYISRDDSNGEVHFVIRDLEKFWIFTEITILPFSENWNFLESYMGGELVFSKKFCKTIRNL